MTRIFSFAPIETPTATILILGSMPGKKSLEMQQYYAHPQNAFWRILSQLLDFDSDGSYEDRIESLRQSGVALWDVLAACERDSSLDSDIVESTIVPNDFGAFLARHPLIEQIYCNGAKSYNSYVRHVRPDLDSNHREIPVTRMPSTSPAHAAMNFESKLQAWRVIKTTALS